MTNKTDTMRAAAIALYKAPFKHQQGYIFDADSKMVADDAAARVRGWGHIQKHADAEALQDTVGELIAEALSQFWQANRTDANAGTLEIVGMEPDHRTEPEITDEVKDADEGAVPCPTCGGSRVDPGGLRICRQCSSITTPPVAVPAEVTDAMVRAFKSTFRSFNPTMTDYDVAVKASIAAALAQGREKK